MSIRTITEMVHDLIPLGLDESNIQQQYTWAILAAVAFVDCLTLNPFEFTYSTSEDQHGDYMAVTVRGGDGNIIDSMVEKLHANNALFRIKDTTVTRSGSSSEWSMDFMFGDYSHMNAFGVSRPASERHIPYYGFEVSWPLYHMLYRLFSIHDLLADNRCDPDTVRWFADRLPDGEARGEHMLMLQNFLYRRIK